MKHLFEELRQVMERGEAAVLVTIIASSGSTPRGAGSRMLVKEDGTIRGTIGGGAVEYRVIQIAREGIRKRSSYVKGFTLSKNEVSDIGMICGGDVTVYFQYICPRNEAFHDLCNRVIAAFGRDEDSWLLLDITEETCWQMDLYNRTLDGGQRLSGCLEELQRQQGNIFESRARQYQSGKRRYYIEPLVRAGTVYVFGGGHVARELVPVLARVGFRCVVMDDRKEFANDERFPDAERNIVGNFERIADYLTVKAEDYVCVMTRGHEFDYLIQRQMLASRPRYIGVIGSKNKIAAVTKRLMEDGFSREEAESCHMPIGMKIHAETPAEIAISIAGELIAVRAGRK